MSDGNEPTMTVRVNERDERLAASTSLFDARDRFDPDADVVILNGFPVTGDRRLSEGDEVVFIKRGRVPSSTEMEALMTARHGPGIHRRVKTARVGIAGCGGLGSSVAVALARTGVGELVLVDFDVVEPSNLNRQQYFVDQIGMPKIEALAVNLARINPCVKVVTRAMRLTLENIPEVFAGCDVVAECFDVPAMKRDITLAVRGAMKGTPLVAVSGIAGTGPGGDIKVRKALDDVYLVGDNASAAAPGRGLLAPRVTIAAGHQANVILRLLLGKEGGTAC